MGRGLLVNVCNITLNVEVRVYKHVILDDVGTMNVILRYSGAWNHEVCHSLIAYEWELMLRSYGDICLPDCMALRPRSVIYVRKDDSISVTINILKFVQQRRKILKPEKTIYPISAV